MAPKASNRFPVQILQSLTTLFLPKQPTQHPERARARAVEVEDGYGDLWLMIAKRTAHIRRKKEGRKGKGKKNESEVAGGGDGWGSKCSMAKE